ncbi:MAG: metal-dependent hydrolase [Thermoplasmata archaeon]|nr:MAG: metal-dependent hydrolase [Thermoplasmata archaeon]
MRLTWLGHAAFLLEGKSRLLVDPFITGNPMAPCKAEEIECDIVCVTHGHGDHLGDAISIAKRNQAPIVAIHEIARYADKNGVEGIGLNMGGGVELKGIKIIMVQAWHSSGIDASNFGFSGGDPAGFIINDEKTVYHAGDTCLFSDMKLIAELYRPQIALLPIGDRFTMNPETAAKAAAWIRPEIAIPMHYNTFPPVEQDPKEFKSLVESLCDSEVLICEPGKTQEV